MKWAFHEYATLFIADCFKVDHHFLSTVIFKPKTLSYLTDNVARFIHCKHRQKDQMVDSHFSIENKGY